MVKKINALRIWWSNACKWLLVLDCKQLMVNLYEELAMFLWMADCMYVLDLKIQMVVMGAVIFLWLVILTPFWKDSRCKTNQYKTIRTTLSWDVDKSLLCPTVHQLVFLCFLNAEILCMPIFQNARHEKSPSASGRLKNYISDLFVSEDASTNAIKSHIMRKTRIYNQVNVKLLPHYDCTSVYDLCAPKHQLA